MPGVIAVIQTFRDRINFHHHLHFLVTEGGVEEASVFHKVGRFDDSRLAEFFGREVLADLVRKELLSPEWAERLLSWRLRPAANISHDSLFARGERSVGSPAHLSVLPTF